MAAVIWRPAALDDLEATFRHVARDSPRNAAALVARIVQATRRLEMFPLSGRLVPEREGRDLREVIEGGYRVVYRVESDAVQIFGVRHGARLLGDFPNGN